MADWPAQMRSRSWEQGALRNWPLEHPILHATINITIAQNEEEVEGGKKEGLWGQMTFALAIIKKEPHSTVTHERTNVVLTRAVSWTRVRCTLVHVTTRAVEASVTAFANATTRCNIAWWRRDGSYNVTSDVTMRWIGSFTCIRHVCKAWKIILRDE